MGCCLSPEFIKSMGTINTRGQVAAVWGEGGGGGGWGTTCLARGL